MGALVSQCYCLRELFMNSRVLLAAFIHIHDSCLFSSMVLLFPFWLLSSRTQGHANSVPFLCISTTPPSPPLPPVPTADPGDSSVVTENTRQLGLVVCRGPQVCLISPSTGMEEIANPFEEEEEEGEEAA